MTHAQIMQAGRRSDRKPLDLAALEVAFAGDPWLGSLVPDHRHLLLDASHLRHFEDGERIYLLGDDADGIYGIVSGAIRMLNYPIIGRQLMNGIIGQGSWFGEISVLDGQPRPHDAIAMGHTTLAMIALPAWRALAARTPGLIEDLARLSCLRIRSVLVDINAFMTRSTESRLARLLLELPRRGSHGEKGAAGLKLCQDDLADLVGVSRQSINRMLRRFEADGLVNIGYARVSVLDFEGLSALLE